MRSWNTCQKPMAFLRLFYLFSNIIINQQTPWKHEPYICTLDNAQGLIELLSEHCIHNVPKEMIAWSCSRIVRLDGQLNYFWCNINKLKWLFTISHVVYHICWYCLSLILGFDLHCFIYLCIPGAHSIVHTAHHWYSTNPCFVDK